MGSIKAPKMVRMGTLPLIRRNPDRHAKRIGYEKTKKEITLNGKKSKPKLELVKKSSQETEAVKKSSSKIEPIKKSPSLKSLPNSGKTHLDAPEAPKMPYVERKFFTHFSEHSYEHEILLTWKYHPFFFLFFLCFLNNVLTTFYNSNFVNPNLDNIPLKIL